MFSRLLGLFFLMVIGSVVGGAIWFGESHGLFHVTGPAREKLAAVPYVGKYLGIAPQLPRRELAEIEKLQEERAREDRWAIVKKAEGDLKRAETDINDEKQRLSQWEAELERREEALVQREKEATDREKQYEISVKYYLSMRPSAAAQILSRQDDILVIEILRRMPERNVAAILMEMDPAVAGAIMRKMAR